MESGHFTDMPHSQMQQYKINHKPTVGNVTVTCSACKASWNSGNRFSYSDGSARESAAFLLTFPKSSFHNFTILAGKISLKRQSVTF